MPGRFERHPALTLAALVAAALVGLDVAGAALLQALGPRLGLTPPSFRVRSPVYHHGFAPMASVDRERWGPFVAPYRTNSLGMRDRTARVVPPRPAGRRLVFIGDSFTEGVGVRFEQTFVGRIQSALEPNGVDVLDAGVASYCPIIDYRRVKQLIEDEALVFDELAVYVDIGDLEDEVVYKLDEDGHVVGRERRRLQEAHADRVHDDPVLGRFFGLERALRLHTLVASTLWHAAERLTATGWHRAGLWTVEPRFRQEYADEGLRLADRHLTMLADLLRARGIALTVAVYPWPDQIRRRDLDSRQVRFWRDWSTRHGARFVDHFPDFVGAGEPEDVIRRYYIKGDIHWNADGHERIAARFLQEWARRE